MSSSFVISLDFELFWGVADSRTLSNYRHNVNGEWSAIPRMLGLFRRFGVQATWATVGMLMCRDYQQWCEIRPTVLPRYERERCSTYSLGALAQQHPKLFFGRPLVEQILETPGQELATHTYSHFYCGEDGATVEQFVADIACAHAIVSSMGAQCRSLVFPRNQVRKEFVANLAHCGIYAYRGNPDHWLYKGGHFTPAGVIGRAARFADAWIPITGSHVTHAKRVGGVVNIPASIFLRPWPRRLNRLESLRMHRLKNAMTEAARSGGICHLWWHPHNFGINVDQNLAMLEVLLKHFVFLRDRYGMLSLSMERAADMAEREFTEKLCAISE